MGDQNIVFDRVKSKKSQRGSDYSSGMARQGNGDQLVVKGNTEKGKKPTKRRSRKPGNEKRA